MRVLPALVTVLAAFTCGCGSVEEFTYASAAERLHTSLLQLSDAIDASAPVEEIRIRLRNVIELAGTLEDHASDLDDIMTRFRYVDDDLRAELQGTPAVEDPNEPDFFYSRGWIRERPADVGPSGFGIPATASTRESPDAPMERTINREDDAGVRSVLENFLDSRRDMDNLLEEQATNEDGE